MKNSDRLTAEANRLVARAYAKLQQAGIADPVDALAAACTQALAPDGACLIPLTEKNFHSYLRTGCTTGLPNRATRIATMPTFFTQRAAVAVAAFEGIKYIEQWDNTCLVYYSEDPWQPKTKSAARAKRSKAS